MDKSKIVAVCIDDFALKKRQRYGTVMIDIQTRKVVDMIESREKGDVEAWLGVYPNIQVVSRDGSYTFAAAITGYARDALRKIIQGRIAVPITSETKRLRMVMLMGTMAEQVRLVKGLYGAGHTKGEIQGLTGTSQRTVERLLAMEESNIPPEKETVRGHMHQETIEMMLERASKIRALHSSGCSITEICRRTGFTTFIVNNCLAQDFSPVSGHYGKQREGKLEPYREEVLHMRLEGIPYHKIYEHICAKGYTGTQDAIRVFMSKERRIQRDLQTMVGGEPHEFVDKKWLFRLLYKPPDDLKGITKEQLSHIFAMHPMVESILHMVHDFKMALMSKDEDTFMRWMEKAAALKVKEIDTFIAGVRRDIIAVRNAVSSDYSNGLAEGSVNKIKVIKRIMYGRRHFPLLRAKILLLQSFP